MCTLPGKIRAQFQECKHTSLSFLVGKFCEVRLEEVLRSTPRKDLLQLYLLSREPFTRRRAATCLSTRLGVASYPTKTCRRAGTPSRVKRREKGVKAYGADPRRVEAHYESREMPFGKVYEWHPAASPLSATAARR